MAADLVPLYYLSATAASLTAVLAGARSYNTKQRRKWQEEGASAQRNTEALEANTKAAGDNTAAITLLAQKLDGFAEETRRELSDHNGRLITHAEEIRHLKDLVEAPLRTRRARASPPEYD